MKVSTREVMQKNADWRASIVANYITYLEQAQKALEQASVSASPLDIGEALGIVKFVKDGLRSYFSKE